MPTIRTIAEYFRYEAPKVKGSRFIASVLPVSSGAGVKIFIDARREEFRDATHNCFAWRLGNGGDVMRSSDDGEPSGTAGRPILQEIDGRRLTDVVVVVTRYFGGTKLGTGGLIRAYGAAAAEALDLAGILEKPVVENVRFEFPYDFSGAVSGLLAAYELSPASTRYGAGVQMEVALPVEDVDQFRQAVRDATCGRAKLAESG